MGVGDDLDPEDICKSWSAVVAESTEYEILALLIEYQDSRQHGGGFLQFLENIDVDEADMKLCINYVRSRRLDPGAAQSAC